MPPLRGVQPSQPPERGVAGGAQGQHLQPCGFRPGVIAELFQAEQGIFVAVGLSGLQAGKGGGVRSAGGVIAQEVAGFGPDQVAVVVSRVVDQGLGRQFALPRAIAEEPAVDQRLEQVGDLLGVAQFDGAVGRAEGLFGQVLLEVEAGAVIMEERVVGMLLQALFQGFGGCAVAAFISQRRKFPPAEDVFAGPARPLERGIAARQQQRGGPASGQSDFEITAHPLVSAYIKKRQGCLLGGRVREAALTFLF